FEAEMEARSRRSQHAGGLRCGPVYVGQGDGSVRLPDLPDESHPALVAVARERRIRAALAGAGPDVELVLRLRFREPLPQCRIPFGLDGSAARRARPIDACIGVRLTPMRGVGNVAHLTRAAVDAWEAARARVDVA